MSQSPHELVNACRAHLQVSWTDITRLFAAEPEPIAPLSDQPELVEAIAACLTSSTKTYHYVLPTQLLAKAVDPTLNAHSLQAAHNVPGAFDARTVAHEVIVPFDQDHHRVLGGSPEPYVNNPVRVPAATVEYRGQQKNKVDWDKLTAVLDSVQRADDPAFTQRVFAQTLFEIYHLLSSVTVVYPTPNRTSLTTTQQVVEQYLAVASGGERMEAVCTALFRTIGEEFHLFDQVIRQKVNAADLSSGMLADIECWREGHIVLLVEAKDRALTFTQLDSKVEAARARQITELLFLAQAKVETADSHQIDVRIRNEFASGHNIYITTFTDFSPGVFILLGEKGRHKFLQFVGEELDRVNARIMHRRDWARLLRSA